MMAPINMALYRLLVKSGAQEEVAEEAARLDTTDLATKADLADIKPLIGDSKSSMLMWIILLLIAQTTLLITVIRALIRA